jgi:hypothetical protein
MPEIRRKAENRNPKRSLFDGLLASRVGSGFELRISDFLRVSAFGLRVYDRSLLDFQQHSTPRRKPNILPFERSQLAAVGGHVLHPARRRAELRRALA